MVSKFASTLLYEKLDSLLDHHENDHVEGNSTLDVLHATSALQSFSTDPSIINESKAVSSYYATIDSESVSLSSFRNVAAEVATFKHRNFSEMTADKSTVNDEYGLDDIDIPMDQRL